MDILAMQRTVGNRATRQYLTSPAASPLQRLIILDLETSTEAEKAVTRVVRAAYSDPTLGALIGLANDPKNKVDLIFTSLAGSDLGKLEKGAEKAAAVTGMFCTNENWAQVVYRFANNPSDPDPAMLLGQGFKDIDTLKNGRIQIKIIVNADLVNKHQSGHLLQIISHEYAVHAMKYIDFIKAVRSDTQNNTLIQSEIESSYNITDIEKYIKNKQFKEAIQHPSGNLSPLKHHLRLITGDGDYHNLKKLLKLQGEEDNDFNEREMQDMQHLFMSLKSLK